MISRKLASLVLCGVSSTALIQGAISPIASAAPQSVSVTSAHATLIPNSGHQTTASLISEAKKKDLAGFNYRVDKIRHCPAFMAILSESTSKVSQSVDFYAAISTNEAVDHLVAITKNKHFEVSGDSDAPVVRIVEGAPQVAATSTSPHNTAPMSMPHCGKAWAAFAAWLAGTTMLCAPFSGPAAWACAVGTGLLGLAPDFNNAC